MAIRPWRSVGMVTMLLVAMVVLSLLIPCLPLSDPLQISLDRRLLPPGSPDSPLGTDELGRDLLSRMLHGLSTTLWVSVAAIVSSLFLGIFLGALAGVFQEGLVDRLLSWGADLILSLPFLLLVAAALTVAQPSLPKAYGVLAGILWIHPFRIVRGEVVRRRSWGYVLAARSLGLSGWQILWRKLVPPALTPAATVAYTYLPEVVVLEAGLSFFGLGVQPPRPGLGKMLFDGLPQLYAAWWLSVFPAAILFVLVLVFNIFSLRLHSQAIPVGDRKQVVPLCSKDENKALVL